jgi:hypothetical protein
MFRQARQAVQSCHRGRPRRGQSIRKACRACRESSLSAGVGEKEVAREDDDDDDREERGVHAPAAGEGAVCPIQNLMGPRRVGHGGLQGTHTYNRWRVCVPCVSVCCTRRRSPRSASAMCQWCVAQQISCVSGVLYKAALTYVLKCKALGAPFKKFNSMTERWEYLHMTQSVVDSISKSWQILTKVFISWYVTDYPDRINVL